MPNELVTLEGEFHWVRTQEPEMSPFGKPGEPPKYQWKAMLRPTQESMMRIIDLQSKGVKNQLKKDDKGYYINFNRPTVAGKRKVPLDPPKVFAADGKTPIEGLVGNGSKGDMIIELYEHSTPTGSKAHAARLYGLTVKEMVEYVPNSAQPEGFN